MAPAKKNNAFYTELTILKRLLSRPDKFNLTSAITTPLPPTPPTRSHLTQTTDQAPLACEAADFWPFLTIVLVFLVAFWCICAART